MRDPVVFCLIAALCASMPSASAAPRERDLSGASRLGEPAPTQLRLDVTVRYSDLDLSREADRKRLAERVDAAASAVCGPRPSRVELLQRQDYGACHRNAVRRAMASVPTAAALASNSGSLPARLGVKRNR
jgi:UrcA family protein